MELTADQIQEWVLEGALRRTRHAESENASFAGPSGNGTNRACIMRSARRFQRRCASRCAWSRRRGPEPRSCETAGHDALIRMGRVMGDGAEFSVPRPLLLRADVGLLAMQWIPGPTMTRSLFNWRCGPARARQMMARAGRWLRRFHDGHELARDRFKTAGMLRMFQKWNGPGTVRDPVFSRAMVQLRESARRLRGKRKPGWIHGDFTTDNLILCGLAHRGDRFRLPIAETL